MTLVPIGTFARMTHLSVKRLRHYHDAGVLPAASVDPSSGYRYYDVDQADDARLVARLRRLDMALPRIAEVVAAPAEDQRRLLAAHLGELQGRLVATSDAVAEVRSMLEPPGEVAVEYRELPAVSALVTSDRVTRDGIAAWCGAAFGELFARLGDRLPAGPGSATYDDGFFTDDVGEVVAFVPVTRGDDAVLVDGGVFAVAVHEGPFTRMDRTYTALGRHVAAAGVGLDRPIRETYVVGPPNVHDPDRFRTEIAWPVSGPSVC